MDIDKALKSELLKEFLNPVYRNMKTLQQIKNMFQKKAPKSVQLQEIWKKEKYKALKTEAEIAAYTDEYEPERYSMSKAEMGEELQRIWLSEEFQALITFITGKKSTGEATLEMFQHQDYTLLSDEAEPSYVDVCFWMAPYWEQAWGGYTSYVQENEEILRIHPIPNSLTFVHVQQGMKKFVKYVNVRAQERIYRATEHIRT